MKFEIKNRFDGSVIFSGEFGSLKMCVVAAVYVRPADQIKWLTAKGWTFEVSSIGRPRVLRSFAESKMGPKEEQPASSWTPNLAAFGKAA